MPPITQYSKPADVSMADEWFEIAVPDHFWMARRFEVLRALLADVPLESLRIGEIGCGSGAVLRQFRDQLGADVDGFDLNLYALEHGHESDGSLSLFCYDIHDRREELHEAYDGLVLFDVIEHIENDIAFLDSVRYHLRPGGFVAVNVPGSMKLFSAYDEVAGHVRRYEPETLTELARKTGFTVEQWTWWGRPLRPIARLRKRVVAKLPRDKVIERGFKPPGRLGNTLLRMLTRMERIPQQHGGCSLMAILRHDGGVTQ